ncbi:hypothetical protein A3768_1919 [Ralstonia solanacearum]|nr:hypothetical protein A3768_1919 [Ralstonia solanacearum]
MHGMPCPRRLPSHAGYGGTARCI